MRTKDEVLTQMDEAYSKTIILQERQLISMNLYLEVLIDIRDIGQCFYERLIDFIKASD